MLLEDGPYGDVCPHQVGSKTVFEPLEGSEGGGMNQGLPRDGVFELDYPVIHLVPGLDLQLGRDELVGCHHLLDQGLELNGTSSDDLEKARHGAVSPQEHLLDGAEPA